MKGRKILVVLDDVWEFELIDAFLEVVRGCDEADVKFLVTSRIFHDDPEILKVKTEELTYTEAENILASHLGLKSIPENLQKDAKFLVDRCGRHPLALAMVASRITRKRGKDPEQWKKVVEAYPALLRQQLYPARVTEGKQDSSFGKVFHHSYGRSIGETMMLTYEDLTPGAKYLLLLIAKSGTSVFPRSVVRLLFAYGVAIHHEFCEPTLFDFYVSNLEDSGAMLRVSKGKPEEGVRCMGYCDVTQLSYESLGLHDLQKEFLSVLKEDNELLEKSLVPATHCSVPLEDSGKMTPEELDRATVLILCILWLRKDFAERAAEKLGVNFPIFGSLSIPILRDALEPLMCLMHKKIGDEMIQCAKQVMVQFLLYGGLDDQSLSRLLTCRYTVSATARMLSSIGHYTCHSLSTEYCLLPGKWATSVPSLDVDSARTRTPATIRSLVHFLGKKFVGTCAIDDSLILDTVLPALVSLATLNGANKRMILADKDFFENMISYLCCSNFRGRLFNTALFWLYFTGCVNDESSSGNICSVRESFKRLLKHIRTENLFLEMGYLGMLEVFCSREDIRKLVLLEFSGTVAGFVELLVNGGDGLLHHVVLILGYLSRENPDVQHQVGGIPGVIPKLLTILTSENSPAHHRNAAAFLCYLSSTRENRKAFLEVPDTVAGLVGLLVNTGDSDLLNVVVVILCNLSCENPDVQHQVGVIPKLLTILTSENSPALHRNSAAFLCYLSSPRENSEAFLEVPDTVAGLVELLVTTGDSKLLTTVAAILGNLSFENPDVQHQVQHQVGRIPGLIPKLLTVLTSENPPILHRKAAVLLYLSICQDVEHQVGRIPGLIPKLLTVLTSENPPILHRRAAVLLSYLSSCQECRKAFLEGPYIVAPLVKLLVTTDDSLVRASVAAILCDKWRITGESGSST